MRGTGRLVVTRKLGEVIKIEGGIEICVERFRAGKVLISIVAPGRKVLRGELDDGTLAAETPREVA